ncbi:hypothetical protein RHSP_71949 [Rhizobium freirei PRF 81]|uniref:Uncharacterized protein n=1 Tax=Rhizobium freirei PRF 81 TaxID=363754 RepID=N6U280_9HYPH|nr:hypothetical protein RHSP_71949 [Rhizobium freirei PRF 81]
MRLPDALFRPPRSRARGFRHKIPSRYAPRHGPIGWQIPGRPRQSPLRSGPYALPHCGSPYRSSIIPSSGSRFWAGLGRQATVAGNGAMGSESSDFWRFESASSIFQIPQTLVIRGLFIELEILQQEPSSTRRRHAIDDLLLFVANTITSNPLQKSTATHSCHMQFNQDINRLHRSFAAQFLRPPAALSCSLKSQIQWRQFGVPQFLPFQAHNASIAVRSKRGTQRRHGELSTARQHIAIWQPRARFGNAILHMKMAGIAPNLPPGFGWILSALAPGMMRIPDQRAIGCCLQKAGNRVGRYQTIMRLDDHLGGKAFSPGCFVPPPQRRQRFIQLLLSARFTAVENSQRPDARGFGPRQIAQERLLGLGCRPDETQRGVEGADAHDGLLQCTGKGGRRTEPFGEIGRQIDRAAEGTNFDSVEAVMRRQGKGLVQFKIRASQRRKCQRHPWHIIINDSHHGLLRLVANVGRQARKQGALHPLPATDARHK